MNTIIPESDNHHEGNAAGCSWGATLDGIGQDSPPRGGDIGAELKAMGKKHHAKIQGQSIADRTQKQMPGVG